MTDVKDSLEEAMRIDGALGVALVDMKSGMCLGTAGGSSGLDLDVAAAGNTEVVRAKMKVMSALGVKGGIEDILITLDEQYHLIRILHSAGSLFMYLALDREKSNLAMARHKLSAIESDLSI